MPPITTCLWFDRQGEQAAEFYVSIFPNSRITEKSHYGDAVPDRGGEVMTVAFELDGVPFTALNGGPQFTPDEAISFQVSCEGQDEVDYYWDALVAGGEESQCGWLRDKFGVSWQIVPTALPQLLGDPDPGRAQRAMQCMFTMQKIDIDEIRKAADAA
jgi:predicted 3-demethylubiquinone-9 3-methyltransferase (glyoxalase superfamily)